MTEDKYKDRYEIIKEVCERIQADVALADSQFLPNFDYEDDILLEIREKFNKFNNFND